MIISGLNLAGSDGNLKIQLDLLFDYLAGLCGSMEEQKNQVLKKTKIFFLGDCIGSGEDILEKGKNCDDLSAASKKFDLLLDQLSVSFVCKKKFIVIQFWDPY